MRWPARHAGALGALTLALGYNLPNLLYPLFEDSALFALVGTWLRRGVLPYVEIADQKPPLIYLLMALATGTLGVSDTALRVFELAFVLVTAAATGFAVERGGARGAGAWTTAAVGLSLSCVLWQLPDRGQVEVYQTSFSALGVAGLVCAVVAPPARAERAWALVVLTGIALASTAWLKPQGALLPLLLVASVGVLAWRHERRVGVRLWLGLALGAGLLSGALVLWMQRRGILDDFWFVIGSRNVDYLRQGAAPSLSAALRQSSPMRLPVPLWWGGWLVFVASLIALWRRGSQSLALALGAWAVAAFAQFWSGRYLFDYHKIVLMPPFAAGVGLGLWCALQALRRRTSSRLAVPLAAVVLALSPLAISRYRTDLLAIVATASSKVSLASERSARGVEMHYFNWSAQQSVAKEIAARTGPEDRVQVLGRASVFYLASGRRPASRFVITSAAFDARRRDQPSIRATLMADLERTRPKFVLVRARDAFPWFGLASAAKLLAGDPEFMLWLQRHYVQEAVVAFDFTVLRRRDVGDDEQRSETGR